jgi:hypothetical protein
VMFGETALVPKLQSYNDQLRAKDLFQVLLPLSPCIYETCDLLALSR